MAAPSLSLTIHNMKEEYSVLLHGDLHLSILDAHNLPNMDVFTDRLRRCFAPCFNIPITTTSRTTPSPDSVSHHHHPSLHPSNVITSDPYVTLTIANDTVARTVVIPNSQYPNWNQHFTIPLAHFASHLYFHVKDNDVLGSQVIGTVAIIASSIADGEIIAGWFPIRDSSGNTPKPGCALHLKMQLTTVDRMHKKLGVERAYFKECTRGIVTLYQDAHVRDGELPEIELEEGRVFKQGKCWQEICQAILDAHKLIYIAGWSIYDKVRLVRKEDQEELGRRMRHFEGKTLGELLKYKSQEGVRILLLVWDDKTSHDKLLFKSRGMMQTHDEDTRKFFKNSSVVCVLSPRYASKDLSIVKQQIDGTLYTHHQKCLLVDTPASGNYRKITAFIGGLDLCDGRYDTPEHRMFADLDTVFANDFHNPTFSEVTSGPRQPWHDLHCKIDGPAAYDVLTNFEQRWRKATKFWDFKHIKKTSSWRSDELLKLERISWILSRSSVLNHDIPQENDSENWHIQILRSIDSGSVKGFPNKVQEAQEQNLVFIKNLVVDKSIHTAYVNAIRSAEHFIYIENQYFIGSSYGWPSYTSAEADNLIPMELALKIASKIRAGKQFAVYIIIPMWPEGLPDSAPVLEILFWQSQTMEMMYKIIAQELKSNNLADRHPQDYLNFYCLGNRELLTKQTSQPIVQPSDKSPALLCQKFGRFMVYVHSKGLIVDDEYVILGSANINQRSLDGSRDTELAMGAYQPHYTWDKKGSHPQGQVYGYRMSLWREHLGALHESFKEPNSPDCVKIVNEIAVKNWTTYTGEEIKSLEGHLLKYPIVVDGDGHVAPLPGYQSFPDVGGKVLGEATKGIPDNLTM